jgi:hypothetical protein
MIILKGPFDWEGIRVVSSKGNYYLDINDRFLHKHGILMNAKEKAEDLIDSFIRDGYDIVVSKSIAKRHALITVDEMLKETSKRSGDNDKIIEYNPYWLEVRKEIQKL